MTPVRDAGCTEACVLTLIHYKSFFPHMANERGRQHSILGWFGKANPRFKLAAAGWGDWLTEAQP